MNDPGYRTLLDRAIVAPEGVTELSDEEGRVAQIERDESYPGAVFAHIDVAAGQPPHAARWVLPATESRPSFYPAEIPFLTGLTCQVMQSTHRVFATWRDETRTEPDPQLSQQFQASVPAPLQAALDEMQAARAAGESVPEMSLEEMNERLGDESVREWTAALIKASQPDANFVAGFDAIVRECLESDWHEEQVQEEGIPAGQRITLRNTTHQRTLTLTGALGMSTLVMTQAPLQAPDSTSA